MNQSPQDRWYQRGYQAGWDRCEAELRQRINELEQNYAHLNQKNAHGCIDAYCAECDGPRPQPKRKARKKS